MENYKNNQSEQNFMAHLYARRAQRNVLSNSQRRFMIEGATLLLSEQDEAEQRNPGGSIPGKHPNLQRNFEMAYQTLYNHYFSENPLYNEGMFRRRFRMSRSLFLRIASSLENYDPYFTHRADALGRWGIRPLVKITAALRMLAYAGATDCNDEYLQISESASLV